jgi:hypothetical protein
MSAPVLILFAAAGALLFRYWSWLRAWTISSRHEAIRVLGFRRWITGHAVVGHMPEAALPHVKRHFFSIVVMVVCLLTVIAIVWIDAVR